MARLGSHMDHLKSLEIAPPPSRSGPKVLGLALSLALSIFGLSINGLSVAHSQPAAASASQPSSAQAQVAAFDAARQLAQRGVAQLQHRYPGLDTSWTSQMPGPNLLLGLSIELGSGTPEQLALGFVRSHADLWGISGDAPVLWRTVRSGQRTSVRLNQTVATPAGRVVVLDRSAVVTFDKQGRLISVSSDFVPTVASLAGAGVGERQARELAAKAAYASRPGDAPGIAGTQARLAAVASLSATRLVWAVDVAGGQITDRLAVVVDAITGEILSLRPVAIH